MGSIELVGIRVGEKRPETDQQSPPEQCQICDRPLHEPDGVRHVRFFFYE